MSNIPADRKYAVTHEWAQADGSGIVTVGISDHAQIALGDVVFVDALLDAEGYGHSLDEE